MGPFWSKKAKAAAKTGAGAATTAKAAAPRTDSAIDRALAATKAAAFEALEKRERDEVTDINNSLATGATLKAAYAKSLQDNEAAVLQDMKFNAWEREKKSLLRHQEELSNILEQQEKMDKVTFDVRRALKRAQFEAMIAQVAQVAAEITAKIDDARPDNSEADVIFINLNKAQQPTAKEQERKAAAAKQEAEDAAKKQRDLNERVAARKAAFLEEQRLEAGGPPAPPAPPAQGMPQVPTGQMDVAAANASKQASYNNMLGVAS